MPIDRILGRYRIVLCGSTLLMVGMSWPLWVDDPDFPRVPFFSEILAAPGWFAWVILVGIAVTLALAMVGRTWRGMFVASLALLAIAVVQDQNRFQPWIYQYVVVGVGLVGVSRARALTMARWYTIGLYAYSGLSKLDASFCLELGSTFLTAAVRPLGLSTEGWPGWMMNLSVLAMPGFELVVAALLAFSRTRRAGLVGAILLHLALLAILGPWSLGHSAIVLVWNLAQIVENLVLFGPKTYEASTEADGWLAVPARLVFGVAMVLPIGERFGFADAWPAHALYASHAERSDVFIHEDDLGRFPESILRRLGPANATPWRRLDLTTWSRDARGTPLYPSGRIGNAVAEFLQTRFAPIQPIRLVQWGRANPIDGHREHDESLGLRAIRRRGDQFVLNAHPQATPGHMLELQR